MNCIKTFIVGSIVSMIGWASHAQADSFTIEDYTNDADNPSGGLSYWGGLIGGTIPGEDDVYGTDASYAVDTLTIDRTADSLTATIQGSYFLNLGAVIRPGDLFISTDGWDPYGSGHYEEDNALTGEDWEYVISLVDNTATSGTVHLYEVDANGNIVYPQDVLGGGVVHYQEYQYEEATGQTAEATGTWSIVGDVFTISMSGFSLADYDLDGEIGVHWTMTCGNDVIEGLGGNEVPEPATMLLFGAGLAGLAGVRSRKQK